jgi:rod shape-determining protein MreD
MSRFLKGLALLAGALLIQILVSHRVPWIQRSVDLVMLVIVFYGSSGSRVGAMLAGAAGGLLEDVWFGDLMGLHGFTKTMIGYLLGSLGSRFDMAHPWARLLAVAAATLIEKLTEPAILVGLGVPAHLDAADLAWRVAGNTLAGALFFFALAGAKEMPARRPKKRVVAT